MTEVVLDASAIIALLKRKRGGSKVAGVVADTPLGVFNQAEVVSDFVRLDAPLDEIRGMLGALPYSVVATDEALG